MTQSSDIEWTNATRSSVASGKGQALRSGIASTLTVLAQEQARKSGRRLHPDEIPSFWGKLKVSMGTTRFNLPIIKRTK